MSRSYIDRVTLASMGISMKSSLHIPMEMVLRQMDLWYRTPLGGCLLEAEQAMLKSFLEDCLVQSLLQVGGPSEIFLFPLKSTFHRVRLSPERMPIFKGPSVRASFEELPFLSESLDIVLLPHVLEFVSNPHIILNESHRVLAPEGRVIILGFNPWSLWGLFQCWVRHKTLPWRGHFINALQVKRWLEKQGFTIEETHTLFFRPPCKSSEKLRRWMVLEALGRLLWANGGAVYCIVARKQVVSLTPIRESFNYVSSAT